MDERTAQINGIQMRWHESGDGQPVIFIHGIPTSPRLWRHVLPRIERARALAWEMVGYGSSWREGEHRDITVARQAEYLGNWMGQLELERAVLVGHDLGGGVAQILAVRQPAKVAGLVLSNSISYDSWPIPSVKILRALSPLVERLPSRALPLIFATFIYRGHDNFPCARESYSEHRSLYAGPHGAATFARQVRSLNVQDTLSVADRLPHLDLPVQIVWGAADQFQPIGYGYRLAYDLRGTLDRIEQGKHFVPEDHPDRIASAIKRVLDQL